MTCNGDLHDQECGASVDSGRGLLCHPEGRPLPQNMPAEHALRLFQQGEEAKEVEKWLKDTAKWGENGYDQGMAQRTLDFINNLALDSARAMARLQRQSLEMMGTRLTVETPEEKMRAEAAIHRLIERSKLSNDHH